MEHGIGVIVVMQTVAKAIGQAEVQSLLGIFLLFTFMNIYPSYVNTWPT